VISDLRKVFRIEGKDLEQVEQFNRKKSSHSPPLSPGKALYVCTANITKSGSFDIVKVKGIGAGTKLPPDMEPEFGVDDNEANLSSLMSVSNVCFLFSFLSPASALFFFFLTLYYLCICRIPAI